MTRILAIETSLRNGSVALAQDGAIVASKVLPADSRSAQSLAPVVKELLAAAGWKPSELSALGVTIGPGSFTGVRVGVAFAKVFCYAAQIPIVSLTTLGVIAHQSLAENLELHVVLDAQRGELFQQAFRITAGKAAPISEPRIVTAQAWIGELVTRDVRVTGAGLAKVHDMLLAQTRVAPESDWEPRAETVALLAHRAHELGMHDDVWTLAPLYLRASAAEEKRAET